MTKVVSTTSRRRNKHLILDQAKLKKAQRALSAKTETGAVERALDSVVDEDERSRRAWRHTAGSSGPRRARVYRFTMRSAG